VQCGSPEFSRATELPVCEPCRKALVRLPFPAWVKWLAVGIAALVAFSLWQAPERWEKAVQVTQAKKLSQAGHWVAAYEKLQPSKEVALQCTDVDFSLEYGEVAAQSGHVEDAVAILRHLEGHRVSREENQRANQLEHTLWGKLHGTQPYPH
jgi:hypothetical protein